MEDDPETEPKKNVSFEEPEKPDKSVSFVMDEEDDEEEEEEIIKQDDDESEEEEIEMKNGGDDEQKESVGVPSKRKPGFAGPLYALKKPVKRKPIKRPKKIVVKDDLFWDCPECTYKNNSEDFKCEMCFASKGTSRGRKTKTNPTFLQDRVAQAMMEQEDKPIIATKSQPPGAGLAVSAFKPRYMSDDDDDDKSSNGGKSPVNTYQKKYQVSKYRDQSASAKWLKYDKLYDCDQCDYQATQQSSLKRHKLAKHEGVRYNCNLCQYTASQQSILKQHKMTEHEGVRYVCDQCDYQATQTSSLKRHKLTQHEGLKQPNLAKLYGISYDCDQCDYKATQLSSLKRHKMAKHEDSRFDCDQCDYHTTTPGNLKLHKKSKHDGIRYPCEVCDYEATQPGALNRHKQNKHSQY